MFSTGHLIFIAISIVLIIVCIAFVFIRKPTLMQLLKVCFPLALISEVIKTLSVIQIIPVVEPVVENGILIYQETGAFAPYIQREHLPFELCSLQIVFMFLLLVIKDRTWHRRIASLMYCTSIIGGTIAIFLSSIAPDFETTAAFLTSIRAWQFFLYHVMIIVLGVTAGMDKETDLHFADIKWAFILILCLDCASFYMNSIMSIPYYQGDNLVGMGYAINYFSSYNNPLGIVMSTKKAYFTYLMIRIAIALVLLPLIYLPLRFKKKEK